MGLFQDHLKINLDDLTSEELDFVYKIFSVNKDEVKENEYNEYGLPKNIDPEILEYVSKTEFNPDTD